MQNQKGTHIATRKNPYIPILVHIWRTNMTMKNNEYKKETAATHFRVFRPACACGIFLLVCAFSYIPDTCIVYTLCSPSCNICTCLSSLLKVIPFLGYVKTFIYALIHFHYICIILAIVLFALFKCWFAYWIEFEWPNPHVSTTSNSFFFRWIFVLLVILFAQNQLKIQICHCHYQLRFVYSFFTSDFFGYVFSSIGIRSWTTFYKIISIWNFQVHSFTFRFDNLIWKKN